MSEYKTGTVKNFNNERYFGFIKPDDNGPDVFVHGSRGAKDGVELYQGKRLQYLEGKSKDNKPQAHHLKEV